MKNKMLLVAFCAVVSQSSHGWGGGLIGSGSDGLIYEPEPAPENTTQVTLGDFGSIRVDGQVGHMQTNDVRIYHCQKDAQLVPVLGSCRLYRKGKVREIIRGLPVGDNYLVHFNSVGYEEHHEGTGSWYPGWVDVKLNTTTVAKLGKIEIRPEYNGAFEFLVMRDFSNEEERQKYLMIAWGFLKPKKVSMRYLESTPENFRKQCQEYTLFNKDVATHNFCRFSWNPAREHYSILEKMLIKFEATQLWSARHLDTACNGTEVTFDITEPPFFLSKRCVYSLHLLFSPRDSQVAGRFREDGSFVSVFPGVYAISYKPSEAQEERIKSGIRVP